MVNNGYEAVARRICWLTFPCIPISYRPSMFPLCIILSQVAWLCTVIFTKIFSARLRASGRPPQAAEAIWALCHKAGQCFPMRRDSYLDLKMVQTADPFCGDMGSHKTIGMGGETSILFTETPIFSGTKEVITYITFGTSPFSIGDLLIPCGRSVHASFSTPSLGCCWDTA